MEIPLKIINQSWILTMEMAPYLILGFLVAGILHVFVPLNTIGKHLGKESISSIIKASLLGIPIPLCSCGVLPVAASLRKAGAGKSATLSFLITTPVTGVDSLMATWALLGWFFTFIRLIVSLFIGLLTGSIMNLFSKSNTNENSEIITKIEKDSCCSNGSCETSFEKSPEKNKKIILRIKDVLHYALVELPESLAGSLIFGLLLAGIISVLVPPDLIKQYIGTGITGIIVAIIVAIPLYVCATASIPIAAVMIATGFTPGAALAFIIAGPATNVVAIMTTKKILGKKALTIYLFSIFIGALVSGILLDYFGFKWTMKFIPQHSDQHFSYLKFGSAIVLILSLIFLYTKNHIKKFIK